MRDTIGIRKRHGMIMMSVHIVNRYDMRDVLPSRVDPDPIMREIKRQRELIDRAERVRRLAAHYANPYNIANEISPFGPLTKEVA